MIDYGRCRSYIFVPLYDPRILRARSYRLAAERAHVLILDLEDSLSAQEKEAGRRDLSHFIRYFSAINPNIMVRINNDENWHLDVQACLHPAVRAIQVPKTESIEHLKRVANLLKGRGAKADVVPLLETPKGVLEGDGLCRELGVPCAFFGSEDLSVGLGIKDPNPANMTYPAQSLILRCAAIGVPVVGVAGQFSGFHRNKLQEYSQIIAHSRNLGFSGAFAIHPRQIPIINGLFEYQEERGQLNEILLAGTKRPPVYSHLGRMYGPPMVRRYRRILRNPS